MSFRPSNKINHAFYLAPSPVLGGSFSSRQYGDLSCILYHVILSKTTVLIRVNQCLNIIRVNSWNLLLKNCSVFSVISVAIHKSVLISVNQCLNIIRVHSWIKNFSATSAFSAVKYSVLIRVNPCLNLYLYLKKQTQFFAVFGPKTAVCRIQSQFKANLNPIQTQFFGFRILYTGY